ncbi:macrophage mannose receptor 1-like [Neocloeon triangulifer]|uniref:macrophage mannose receptor 1-like n=1 Tax=Neocloeon triangulifer TaxID=2078957 RepID=UPI00286F015F|nr:macrophage mannose receptor 1-like [Neocloeon triangulifer]
MYIGLTMEGMQNYSAWVNGTPLTFTDWLPGNPSQIGSKKCVGASSYHWMDITCTDVYNYACEDADPCFKVSSKYNVSSDTKTWGGARAACKTLGGDLVSIDSEMENYCVLDNIEQAGKNSSIVFHGLNKMGRVNYTSLYSGASPTFTDWKTGEPAQFSSEHCGAIQNKYWMDTSCSGANTYVCEFPAPVDVCSKYAFFVSTDQKPYQDAKFECLKRNMTIIDLETVEENACFAQFLAEKGLDTTSVTIGLDKSVTKNYTTWSNNKPLTYTDWDVNNPTAFATDNCVVALNGHWQDALCSASFLYGCESSDYKNPCDGFGNYTISTTSKSWIDSLDECKRLGGGLTSLETPEENFCVQLIIYLAGKKSNQIWHSLNKMGSTYFTHWGNGELLTYYDFAPTYNPNGWTGQHCGIFDSGHWGDYACSAALPFVCEFNPAPKEICIEGQFQSFGEWLTYDNAKLKCISKGLQLASLDTIFESFCSQREIMRTGHNGGWIFVGSSRRGDTFYNKWDDGVPLNYSVWAPGEPSGFAGGDECLLFIDGHWYDLNCGSPTWYVCENTTAGF